MRETFPAKKSEDLRAILALTGSENKPGHHEPEQAMVSTHRLCIESARTRIAASRDRQDVVIPTGCAASCAPLPRAVQL